MPRVSQLLSDTKRKTREERERERDGRERELFNQRRREKCGKKERGREMVGIVTGSKAPLYPTLSMVITDSGMRGHSRTLEKEQMTAKTLLETFA